MEITNLTESKSRYYRIVKLHSSGMSFNSISKTIGISRQRVSQIVKKGEPKLFKREQSKLEKYLISVNQTTGRSRAREMVRLRDNHTCQDCGVVKKTKDVLKSNLKVFGLKGKTKSLDVHHLEGQCGKNSVGYDSPKDISKMITLCHKCHYNRPEHRSKQKSLTK